MSVLDATASGVKITIYARQLLDREAGLILRLVDCPGGTPPDQQNGQWPKIVEIWQELDGRCDYVWQELNGRCDYIYIICEDDPQNAFCLRHNDYVTVIPERP